MRKTDMGSEPVDARELVTRVALLEHVTENAPVSGSDLADDVGTSVSTVNRVVSSFVDRGMLERAEEGVVLTPYGEVLAEETRRFVQSVEAVQTLQPLLPRLVDASVPFELEWFVDAAVTRATPDDPYAPLRRYSELFTDSEQKRLVGDQFVVPEQGVKAASDALSETVNCTCVWSEQALERLLERYPGLVEWSADQENLTVLVTERVPFDLALFDERLLVYGFDDRTGVMSLIVDTDNSDAVEWGGAVFEECSSAGEHVDLLESEA